MGSATMPAPGRRLPVWLVVTRSYGFVWEERREFVLPIAVIALLSLAYSAFVPEQHMPPGRLPSAELLLGFALRFGMALLLALTSMSFVVGVHRAVLLDEFRRGIASFHWDRNLLRYFGTSLALGVIGVLCFTAVGLVLLVALRLAAGSGITVGLGLVVAYLAAGVLLLRLVLALPAAAIGRQDRLTLSWRSTRGHLLRLLAICLLTWLPFLVVGLLLFGIQAGTAIMAMRSGVPVSPATFRASLPAQVLWSVLGGISAPVIAVMLSLCYDVLVRGGGPRDQGATGVSG